MRILSELPLKELKIIANDLNITEKPKSKKTKMKTFLLTTISETIISTKKNHSFHFIHSVKIKKIQMHSLLNTQL